MMMAQAEIQKSQAEMVNAQSRSMDTQIKAITAQANAQKAQSDTVLNYTKAADIDKKQVLEAIRLIKDLTQDQIRDAIDTSNMQ